MIVIVGHGPSILSGLGSVIDTCTVVRLKHGRMREAKNWGTRTDYLCGRSLSFAKPGVAFWHFEDGNPWYDYFEQFQPRHVTQYGTIVSKPSHGLSAAFMAVEHLQPKQLAFIGCDTLLNPQTEFRKWNTGPWGNPHDWTAEHCALHSLGVEIIDLRDYAKQIQEAGEVHVGRGSQCEVRQEGGYSAECRA